MTTVSPPSPTQPQSIVHKLGRMVSPFAKQSSQRRLRLSLTKLAKDVFDDSEMTEHTEESDLTERTHRTLEVTEHDDQSSNDSFGECSVAFEESILDFVALNDKESDFFVPLNQNEFLVECFMTNECSDVTFIVHFYAADSALSEPIEDLILIRSMEAGSHCQCRRVNAELAPLFTKKLNIDPKQPTIVAIRNGAVISQISDISSSGCWELEKWIADTGILEQPKSASEFARLNTLSC
ncbi:unnamed protein product [Cylindrotheca closterium]|uniref:Phosducin thioredoxin-like domain-containing protein n=1 Tax=Cylindrotheca closterium TaxID=2856 RepID=A0AAD2G9Q3_9STRA|nr:unnamed protein product [Cylindrotheca closterium]